MQWLYKDLYPVFIINVGILGINFRFLIICKHFGLNCTTRAFTSCTCLLPFGYCSIKYYFVLKPFTVALFPSLMIIWQTLPLRSSYGKTPVCCYSISRLCWSQTWLIYATGEMAYFGWMAHQVEQITNNKAASLKHPLALKVFTIWSGFAGCSGEYTMHQLDKLNR